MVSKVDAGRLDELLDWLAEEVADRLRRKPESAVSSESPALTTGADVQSQSPLEDLIARSAAGKEAAGRQPASSPSSCAPVIPTGKPASSPGAERIGADSNGPVEPPTARDEGVPHGFEPGVSGADAGGFRSHAAQLMSRLAIGLLVAVILINIPLNARGKALARAIPASVGVVVRNGVLVKEADKPEVYVYQNGQFRWIVDPDAFDYYGYRWQNVHDVSPGFLADYGIGNPLYRVAKCRNSPHIYRLENGVKRWIVDIVTFEAEGLQWSDVQVMECGMLEAMPMGETIPPGRGPAPQP